MAILRAARLHPPLQPEAPNGRTQAKVDAAVARIGGNARGVAADLGQIEGHDRLVAAEPRADIVVSNLGIFEPADFFATDDATWDRHWQVNVMAGVRLARAYLPSMEENGWGRFLLLGSGSTFNIPAEMIHYGVSKTADVALALTRRSARLFRKAARRQRRQTPMHLPPVSRTVRVRPKSAANDQTKSGHLSGHNSQL